MTEGPWIFTPAINWWGLLTAHLRSIQIFFVHPQHAPISTPTNSVYSYRLGDLLTRKGLAPKVLPPRKQCLFRHRTIYADYILLCRQRLKLRKAKAPIHTGNAGGAVFSGLRPVSWAAT